MRFIHLLGCLCILSTVATAQSLKLPALSPTCKLSQGFSTSTVDIEYSRPSVRGRKIFGDLVPFGSVWRTGANAATTISFGEEVSIGGTVVKAGKYSFYTVPGESSWEIILNKNTGSWGAYGYDKADDVARFTVPSQRTARLVETFTIELTNITFTSCNIELSWENTQVVVPVTCNNAARLAADIEKAINNPSVPYHQAASYYFETNQNLAKALEYETKATEQNPKAYYMWMLKARIAAKLGNKSVAKQAAETAIETAKGTSAEAEYAHMGTELIKSL